MKNKKRIIALASIAILLGVALVTSLSSGDLQGARRKKLKTPKPATTQQIAPAQNFNFPTKPTPPAPTCGDGNVNSGEACDDGNTANGDGCSATCTVEAPPAPVTGNVSFQAISNGWVVYRSENMPDIYVSSICTPTTNWEPVGQWGITMDSNFNLERVKLQTNRQNNPSSFADDYRLVVSTGKDNYSSTTVATTEKTTTQDSFVMEFTGTGVLLQDNPSLAYLWTGANEYYLTLEAKVKRNDAWPNNAGTQRTSINAVLINDGSVSWSNTNSNIALTPRAGTNAPGVSYPRWVDQNDATHPDPACIVAAPIIASADMDFTINIKEVQIEACTTDTDWHAVYQGTITPTDADLQLDVIPTQAKKLGSGSAAANQIGEVKAIISTTADYQNTEIANYEYAPSTYRFGMPTNGLLLNAGTTYYVTYLVKRSTTFSIAPAGNSVTVQMGMYSFNNQLAPFGTFVNGVTADESNVNIDGLGSVFGVSTGGLFNWTACSQ